MTGGAQPRARHLHGVDARLGVAAGQLDELRLDRHAVEARVLLRPECVEVGGLGMGHELLGLHARAAVEEHALVHALEAVHRRLALGRVGIAAERLLVALAVLAHHERREAHEAGLVGLGAVDERLGGRRGFLALLDDAVVARALPLDEVRALGERFRALQRERERHRLARRVVDRARLVRLAVQHGFVEFACGEERGSERRTRGRHQQFQFHFKCFPFACEAISLPHRADARHPMPQNNGRRPPHRRVK